MSNPVQKDSRNLRLDAPLDCRAIGTNTPLAHVVVSPIVTCAGGVFPSTHWRRYRTCARVTCTVWWWFIYIHICIIPSPSLSSLLPSAQPPSTVSVSDAATSLTPPPTPPAPDTAGESVIELQCALLHIQLILVLSLSPLATDIIKALNHQLDAKWRHFGIFLGIDYQLMETIETRKRGNPEDCMLDLLGKWTSNQAGTGALPRTWKTVVEAVKETGFGAIAEVLALKHGVNLPH